MPWGPTNMSLPCPSRRRRCVCGLFLKAPALKFHFDFRTERQGGAETTRDSHVTLSRNGAGSFQRVWLQPPELGTTCSCYLQNFSEVNGVQIPSGSFSGRPRKARARQNPGPSPLSPGAPAPGLAHNATRKAALADWLQWRDLTHPARWDLAGGQRSAQSAGWLPGMHVPPRSRFQTREQRFAKYLPRITRLARRYLGATQFWFHEETHFGNDSHNEPPILELQCNWASEGCWELRERSLFRSASPKWCSEGFSRWIPTTTLGNRCSAEATDRRAPLEEFLSHVQPQ